MNFWVVFGFAGQFLFMMRFIVQWISSEKRGESYIPLAFWYFSLLGGIVLFVYSIYRNDPVFIVGQGIGIVVYIRNLILIARKNSGGKNEKSN